MVPATVAASRYGQRPSTGVGAGVEVVARAGGLVRAGAGVLRLGLVGPGAGAAVPAGVDPLPQPARHMIPTASPVTVHARNRTATGYEVNGAASSTGPPRDDLGSPPPTRRPSPEIIRQPGAWTPDPSRVAAALRDQHVAARMNTGAGGTRGPLPHEALSALPPGNQRDGQISVPRAVARASSTQILLTLADSSAD